MYYFKKLSLSNRKIKLVKQVGKLNLKIQKLENDSSYFNRNKISLLETKVENITSEIDAIDEILEYLQREKPKFNQKVSNNSLNLGLKNESGATIELPPIIGE